MNNLLEPVSTVIFPGTDSPFVVREKFVPNNGIIRYCTDNFIKHFHNKVEALLPEERLLWGILTEPAIDDDIIADLGGRMKAEMFLAHVFFLMEQQRNGQDGALLNNGSLNIFYIRDCRNVLCAVTVRWSAWLGGVVGWCVGACSVGNPSGWFTDYQFFCQNPNGITSKIEGATTAAS